MNSAERDFFAIEAGESRPGKSIQIRGYQLLVKVSGDDNGGEFAVFEVPALPNTTSTSSTANWMFRLERKLFV